MGYKVSRVLWSTLKKNMKFVKVSLSAGRVQSSALRIIVERERLRQAFHSALYYDLKAIQQLRLVLSSLVLFFSIISGNAAISRAYINVKENFIMSKN